MGLNLNHKIARFSGICPVEDAGALHAWVQAQERPRADLSDCEHLHTALLQILLARHVEVTGLPKDPWLREWLAPLVRAARAAPRGIEA